MVFTPHMIVGGALARLSQVNFISAFAFGFLSHYILDSIPHWDYKLRSSSKSKTENPLDGEILIGRSFLFDLIKVGFDFLIGLSLVIFFFEPQGFFSFFHPIQLIKNPIIWGAIGGIFPDILQFAYYRVKREPLTTMQKIHDFFHTSIRLSNRKILGPTLQIIFIALVIYLTQLLY